MASQKKSAPRTSKKQSLAEPLIVRGMGTIMGYFRPPKAFVNLVRELNPDINSETMPEPTPFLVRENGVIQLIYEFKEETLCQPKQN